MSIIDVQHISKKYHATRALQDISLRVDEGEIYGFLGPNGAGKTTAIRCLMGFIKPDTGTITIAGLDAQVRSTEVKKVVGYVPAEPQLYDKWTGNDHINFYKSVLGPSATVRELASRLSFDVLVPVHHLSTGNKQKLALILAIMHTPRVLIMDEPTHGLDPLLQQEFYRILLEYRDDAQGTVFISSQNLSEVEKLCTRVGIIRAGELVASEAVRTIRDMKMHVMTVTFQKPHQQAAFLKNFKEEKTVINPHTVKLRLHGGLQALTKQLAAYDLEDLEIVPATLEDVFLAYYQEGAGQ